MTLGEFIRDERKDMGLRELARQVRISPSYLSDIENDRRIPSEKVLRRLATKLGVPVERAMAHAGIVGEAGEKYLRGNVTAWRLLLLICEKQISEVGLRSLLATATEKL